MITFRNMVLEDIEQVIAIENSVYTNPWPASAFEPSLLESAYVLDFAGVIVGFVICIVVIEECTIINVAISPDHQRCGYGRLLFNELLQTLSERDIQLYYLDVRESNIAARKLYEGLGFKRIALRKSYYSHPDEDAVVMCLDTKDQADSGDDES